MNDNIDLTKILEGCPKGTELYSTIYGKVRFERINNYDAYPIEIKVFNKFINPSVSASSAYFVKDGRCSTIYDGECTLFPSQTQRDWSKFERFWDKLKVEKFDPKTLHPFDKILARDYQDELWSIELFSHKTGNIVKGLCHNWCYAIPFNENTKHLIGTREDCPDYYKWWEE